MINQRVLPFNLEIANDEITSHAGVAPFGGLRDLLGLFGFRSPARPAGYGLQYKCGKTLSPILGNQSVFVIIPYHDKMAN